MTREHDEAPHVFVHDDVSIEPRWADMAGRYTRFGDVRPLLTAADDRYVIMKGGDAVRLEFDAAVAPAPSRRLGARLAVRLRRLGQGRRQEHGRRPDGRAAARSTAWTTRKYGELEFPDSPEHREFVREYLTRRGRTGRVSGRAEGKSRVERSRVESETRDASRSAAVSHSRPGFRAGAERRLPRRHEGLRRLACAIASRPEAAQAHRDHDRRLRDGRLRRRRPAGPLRHQHDPALGEARTPTDCGRLYRNVGGRFEDVTAKVGHSRLRPRHGGVLVGSGRRRPARSLPDERRPERRLVEPGRRHVRGRAGHGPRGSALFGGRGVSRLRRRRPAGRRGRQLPRLHAGMGSRRRSSSSCACRRIISASRPASTATSAAGNSTT